MGYKQNRDNRCALFYCHVARLFENTEALAAYQKFLASADARTNQLEIEKVKLRLPLLQRQIQLGEGVKKKP